MTRFDDEFLGLSEGERDVPRTSSINPFEIALWVLGVVLLVGGLVSLQWSVGGFGRNTGPESEGFVARQMTYVLGPAAVTAGLFAVVVSLALRATLLALVRRASSVAAAAAAPIAAASTETRPAESTQPAPPAAERAPQLDPLQFAPPQLRSRRRDVDHSAYRRPPAD
jgi:hypothetical protein